jgi:hypothetical protein
VFWNKQKYSSAEEKWEGKLALIDRAVEYYPVMENNLKYMKEKKGGREI